MGIIELLRPIKRGWSTKLIGDINFSQLQNFFSCLFNVFLLLKDLGREKICMSHYLVLSFFVAFFFFFLFPSS